MHTNDICEHYLLKRSIANNHKEIQNLKNTSIYVDRILII